MEAKRRRVTRECVICRDDKGIRAFAGQITDACEHVRDVCQQCMASTIRMEITCKGQAAEVNCPTCASVLSLSDVARESSQEEANQLDKLLLQKALSQDPSFCWCAHGCEVGQILEEFGPNIFMTCQECKRRTCTHHRSVWHQEQTCAEYDKEQNERGEDFSFTFTVDNSQLQSEAKGVSYRRSPKLEDKARCFAPWEACVHGSLHSAEWIAVGDLFLPLKIRKMQVLQPREDSYQVDNTVLQSTKNGVFYRSSPTLEAKTSEIAEWESFVRGTPFDRSWIKVGSAFLPIFVRGIRILKMQAGLCQYMQEKNIQCCPSCRQGIEKRRGCDHMKCPCGAEFCYLCGANYLGADGIFAVGNHAHKATCKHYRAWVWWQT